MPMQPKPSADTSKPSLPKIRFCMTSVSLRTEQRLDRSPLVHRLVAVCDLAQRQYEIEHLSRIHLALRTRSTRSGRYRRTGADPPSRRTCRKTRSAASDSAPCGTPTSPTDPPGRV